MNKKEAAERVTEWKKLRDKHNELDDKLQSVQKQRRAGMWTIDSPEQLSKSMRKLGRKMSEIQIAVENAGYDFHLLL